MVRWATDALDEVRRQAWNDARRLARETEAKRGPGRQSADAPDGQCACPRKGVRLLNDTTPDDVAVVERRW